MSVCHKYKLRIISFTILCALSHTFTVRTYQKLIIFCAASQIFIARQYRNSKIPSTKWQNLSFKRVKKRVSERVLQRAMHIIRSQTLGRCLASAKSLAETFAESLTKRLAETLSDTLGETFGEIFCDRQAAPQSLGSDYIHGFPQDSLRDSFNYAEKNLHRCDVSFKMFCAAFHRFTATS